MAPSLPRRRSAESHPFPRESIPLTSTTAAKSSSLSISPTFILLLFLTIWCTSNLLSSSFHVCVSSRKLDLYCISGGLNPSNFPTTSTANTLVNSKLDENITSNLDEDITSIAHSSLKTQEIDSAHNIGREIAYNSSKTQEVDNAYNIVREQLQLIRSWASASIPTPGSCDGRGVFVYDLPSKFNKDLLTRCSDLLPWTDLCDHFDNEGKGQPIPKLGKGWYRTHQYSLELIFHSRVLKHRCRVWNPDDAKLFYVPFYGGLDILRWHFKNVSSDVKDALGLELVRWLEGQQPWKRNGGRDHMFVLGKISWDFRRREEDSWGSKFLLLDEMHGAYKFLIERQPWEVNDIGVPHPTHFHPSGDGDIVEWQAKVGSSERRSLVAFAGAARPEQEESIRSALIKSCVASSGDCRFLDCSSGSCSNPEEVIAAFAESEFCLQPPGDSPTRKSVFDSLISGCIPVLFDPFTAYYQYPWHLPEDHRRYSVFIDKEEVRGGRVDVIERLKSISVDERKEMRRYIVFELMPGLVYGDSSSEFARFRDAFGIVMDNMVELVAGSKDG